MFGIGPTELFVILIVALIIFGPRKLPEIGQQLGRALREFKKSTQSIKEEISEAVDAEGLKEMKNEISSTTDALGLKDIREEINSMNPVGEIEKSIKDATSDMTSGLSGGLPDLKGALKGEGGLSGAGGASAADASGATGK